MNWVGGARSRIRQKGERKTQKDYFERKRLQAKAANGTTRSSHGKGKKLVSQDLLFLQTLSSAHGSSKELAAEPPKLPRVQKIDFTAAEKGFKRLDRGLTLPMSPIGKPSSLDLSDTSCSLSFSYNDDKQPMVSTQKLPYGIAMSDFGPPMETAQLQSNAKPATKAAATKRTFKQYQHNTLSCLTESILPPCKRPKTTSDHVYPPTLAEPEWVHHAHRVSHGHTVQQNRQPWMHVMAVSHDGEAVSSKAVMNTAQEEVPPVQPGKMQISHTTFEESYDSETPFRFKYAPKPQRVKPLPKSLLQFQQSQGDNKNRCSYRKETLDGRAVATAEHEAAEVPHLKAQLPRLQALSSPPPPNCQNEACAEFGTSSVLDEGPRHTKELRPVGNRELSVFSSAITSLNESILGPIHKATMKPQVQQRSNKMMKEGKGRKRGRSAFEKMMCSFETSKTSPSRGERMVVVDKGERNEGTGRESGRCGLDHEWRTFVMGARRPVAASEVKVQNENKAIPCRKKDSQAVKSKGRSSRLTSSKSKPFHGLSSVRNKNISVIEELITLDEELTANLEGDTMPPSQDFTMTPGIAVDITVQEDPFQPACVPDLDCCIENPLVMRCNTKCSLESRSRVCEKVKKDSVYHVDEHKALSSDGTNTATLSPNVHICEEPPSMDLSPNCSTCDSETNLKCLETVPAVFICEATTQTEPARATLCREVSCECDIWIEKMVHTPAAMHSVAIQASHFQYQSSADASSQTIPTTESDDSIVQMQESSNSSIEESDMRHETIVCGTVPTSGASCRSSEYATQSSDEPVHTLLQEQGSTELTLCGEYKSDLNELTTDATRESSPLTHLVPASIANTVCIASETEHSLSGPDQPMPARGSSVAVQVSLDEATVSGLHLMVSHLTQKLEAARSIIAWQSLKLKLLEVEQCP